MQAYDQWSRTHMVRRFNDSDDVFNCLVSSVFAGEAEDILRTSGAKGGLVVHIGCGDGKLTAKHTVNGEGSYSVLRL